MFFWRARVCWPLLCLDRPFCIFDRCLDSDPKSCRQACYQLSHPSLSILIPVHTKPVKKERKWTPWGRQRWSRPQTLPEAFHWNKPISSGKCQHNQYGTCQPQLNPSGDPVPLIPVDIKLRSVLPRDRWSSMDEPVRKWRRKECNRLII